MTLPAVSRKDVREYLGHNGVTCKVRIREDGSVERYRSVDPYERSKDYWEFMGYKDEIVAEIEESNINLDDKGREL